MIIKGFGRTSSPDSMAVSAITQAPNFTIPSKSVGFECPFWAFGSEKSASYMTNKGNTVFPRDTVGAAPQNKFATVYASDSNGFDFSNNQGAYNAGFNFAYSYKTIVLDFENQYGDYNNPTNVEIIGNFIKGARDNGAKVGEYLYRIWSDIPVWHNQARAQLTNPVLGGISTKQVASLNTTLGALYNLYTAYGYGTMVVTGRQAHDPRAAMYNYIHGFLVHQKMRQTGLISQQTTSIGYLWGASDTFSAGIPNFWHRIPLNSPYDGNIRVLNRSEESLKIMKGYAIWGLVFGDGFWYWNGHGVTSDTKNDVIDILQSGFPGGEMAYDGTSTLNMPNPRRIYPYLDGLSMDSCFEGAHEFSLISSVVQGGTRTDPNYSFARSGGSWQSVTINQNGTSIVDAYDNQLPILSKIVKNSDLVFVVQDPSCTEGKVTKIKVAHGNKSYFLTANCDEPKIYKFAI